MRADFPVVLQRHSNAVIRIPVIYPTSKARGIFLSVWCLIPLLVALLFAVLHSLISAVGGLL